MSPRRATLASVLLSALALAACAPESRVVSVSGGLYGLPGAVGGLRPQAPEYTNAPSGQSSAASSLSNPRNYQLPPGSPEPDDLLRIHKPDKSVILVSRNARELAFHLRETLRESELELIEAQVLSDAIVRRYRARGLNPAAAVDFLVKHKQEILRTLTQMHMAERLPFDVGENIGPNQYRLEVPQGTIDPPLKFRRFDYVFEPEGCRLLLIH